MAEQPLVLRLPILLASCCLSWQWLPLYGLAVFGADCCYRRRHKPAGMLDPVVATFTVLVLAARLPFGRFTARYNPYLLPALVVLIAFIDFDKIKRWVWQATLVLFGLGLVADGALAAWRPYGKQAEAHGPIITWLTGITPQDERVRRL